jgi:hypothetical protein
LFKSLTKYILRFLYSNFLLFFWWDCVRTQGFMLAKQVLYCLSHTSNLNVLNNPTSVFSKC